MSLGFDLGTKKPKVNSPKVSDDILDKIIDTTEYGNAAVKTRDNSSNPALKEVLQNGYVTPTGNQINLSLRILDPKRTRVSKLNKRNQTHIDTTDLETQIRAAGTNIAPVLVRPVNNNDQYDWEVIWGSRRRHSCERTNKPLTALCGEMSDKDAIYLATLENADKKDLNPFEWSEQYQLFLDTEDPIFKSVSDLSQGLGIGRQYASKIYNLKTIPAELYTRFGKNNVTVRKAALIKKLYDNLSDKQKHIFLQTLKADPQPFYSVDEISAKLSTLGSASLFTSKKEEYEYGADKKVVMRSLASGDWKIELTVAKKPRKADIKKLIALLSETNG